MEFLYGNTFDKWSCWCWLICQVGNVLLAGITGSICANEAINCWSNENVLVNFTLLLLASKGGQMFRLSVSETDSIFQLYRPTQSRLFSSFYFCSGLLYRVRFKARFFNHSSVPDFCFKCQIFVSADFVGTCFVSPDFELCSIAVIFARKKSLVFFTLSSDGDSATPSDWKSAMKSSWSSGNGIRWLFSQQFIFLLSRYNTIQSKLADLIGRLKAPIFLSCGCIESFSAPIL